jgi:hypothetical protein
LTIITVFTSWSGRSSLALWPSRTSDGFTGRAWLTLFTLRASDRFTQRSGYALWASLAGFASRSGWSYRANRSQWSNRSAWAWLTLVALQYDDFTDVIGLIFGLRNLGLLTQSFELVSECPNVFSEQFSFCYTLGRSL